MAPPVTPIHTPVLLAETLELLAVRPAGVYIDCTTGLGGHSAAIAAAMGDDGRLLCIDQDASALAIARTKLAPFGRRASFAQGNFRDLAAIAGGAGFPVVDGILMDLGVSSLQFGDAARGFAFALEGPLDMRMDATGGGLTAAEIVNSWDQDEIETLLRQDGEEPRARRIAAAIVRARPVATTWALAKAVEQAVGGMRGSHPIHPATRAFQALRIRVNEELDALDAALPQAHGLLGVPSPSRDGNHGSGGRLAVISFQSLEDRRVKDYFRREATDCVCPPVLPVCRCGHRATLRLLTRKAIRPSPDEVAANPRARSARLRTAARTG